MSANRTLALAAGRPTLQAQPQAATMQRLVAAPTRSLYRSRHLFDLLRRARDFNPDVAKAVDNILTLANPGYDLAVYFAARADDDGKPVPDPEGLRLLRQFCVRMHSEYSGASDGFAGQDSVLSGLDSFVNMVHLNAVSFGAAAAEVELSGDLSDIVDVYPVDPTAIDFKRDPDTGRIEPGLMTFGPFKPLDPIRFRYIGKDPDVNNPAGRSPLSSVVDTVTFQQEFLRELQAVVHMHNSPRLDVKVLEEVALSAIRSTRPDLVGGPGQDDALREALDGYLADIQTVVDNLEPDDAFVHYDAVETQVISAKGTAIPVDQVMDAISTMMVSGTKQLPVLLGRNESTSTTHATVQWQLFVSQLGGYQRISRALVTWALNLYLRVIGRESYVVFGYKRHKTSDDMQDAQALLAKTSAWEHLVSLGWATNDEAAQAVVGHPPVGPRMLQNEPSQVGDQTSGANDVTAVSLDEVMTWLREQRQDLMAGFRQMALELLGGQDGLSSERLDASA